ncbi:hypothetical protein D3C71_1606080 [compost metagenome]
MLRTQGGAQTAHAVDEQEQGAAVAHGGFEPGQGIDGQSETGHPCGDQDGVGHRARQADGEDVFLAQSLPQDKRVLRANRDDEPQAEQEAGNEGGGHGLPCKRATD